MSAIEIIKELPRLSEADRRSVREVLLEIANANPDVALCNESATAGAVLLDRMEDEDAGIHPGEIWVIDFGMAAKVRPALLLTGQPADDELDLITVLLHTTALRGKLRLLE